MRFVNMLSFLWKLYLIWEAATLQWKSLGPGLLPILKIGAGSVYNPIFGLLNLQYMCAGLKLILK